MDTEVSACLRTFALEEANGRHESKKQSSGEKSRVGWYSTEFERFVTLLQLSRPPKRFP